MIKKILPLLLLIVFAVACQGTNQQKYLLILQAGTEGHEGMARAVHALLYATELDAAGYDVTLIFDGAGTEWADALRDPANKLHARYQALKEAGITEIICDFCAGAFDVKETLQGGEVPLVAEYEGHPSIVKWIRQGYVPIVL